MFERHRFEPRIHYLSIPSRIILSRTFFESSGNWGFQFHQGLSREKKIFFTTVIDTFNSIKDYQTKAVMKFEFKKYVFQFHQGLSKDTSGIQPNQDSISFNSIKDYPGIWLEVDWLGLGTSFNSIKDYLRVSFIIDFSSYVNLSIPSRIISGRKTHEADTEEKYFQFHQGLSKYFYTLTILLFLPPLI